MQVLDYKHIPWDSHRLRFSVRFGDLLRANPAVPPDSPHAVACFDSSGATQLDIDSNDENALWRVKDFTSQTEVVLASPKARLDGSANLNNPWVAQQAAATNAGRDYWNYYEICQSVFYIHIDRINAYHLINYICVEALLVILGWFTFFMDPLAVDVRLSIALTLVLAINVFQIVLVENMPETGYITDLHSYTFYNTVLLALIALQSIVVCEAVKREAKKKELEQALRSVKNNPEVDAKVRMLQRYIRRFILLRKAAIRRRSAGKRQQKRSTRGAVLASSMSTGKRFSSTISLRRKAPGADDAGGGSGGSGDSGGSGGQRLTLEGMQRLSRQESNAVKAQSVVLQFAQGEELFERTLLLPTKGCWYRTRQRWKRFCARMNMLTARHGDWVSAFILFPAPFLTYTVAFAAGYGQWFSGSAGY